MALNFLNNGYFAGKVGIGAESPSRNLQVKGTANTAIAITAPTTGLAQLALGDTDDDNYAQILLDNSTNKLQIQNGGGGVVSNRGITLDSSENVGIGTASPSRPLHVNGGALNFVAEFQSTDDKASILIQDDDTLNYIHSQDGYLSLGGQSLLSASNLNINSSSGNVGIGTTSPVSSLNITTTKTVALDTAAKFLTLGLTVDDLTAGNTAGGGGGIAFRSKNTNAGTQIVFGAIDAIKESANVSDFKGSLRFFTNQNSTGIPLERMRIDSVGNVGIGTDSPGSKLTVNGSFSADTGSFSNELTLSSNLRLQNNITILNKAQSAYISFATRNTTGSEVVMDLTNVGSINGGAAGPYLPLAGGTMTGTGAIVMPDGFKLQLGNGIFSIFNDGTYSIIRSANEPLLIDSNGITFRGYSPYNTLATITSSGISVKSALLSNQENTDVDTGTETVANVAIATYTAAFFDFVIKKTTNVRAGTVYACHDGTNVEFTETSTQDLGDTSDVTLSVDISGGNMRLRATTTSDDWSVKSLIRAI